MNNQDLLLRAVKIMEYSYSPYSKFPVAAVALMKDGRIFGGVNVENASYGGTICAERSAVVSAISNGYKATDFEKILIVSNLETPISPCGICRQFLLEFFTEENEIIMANKEGKMLITNIEQLVPYGFRKSSLDNG